MKNRNIINNSIFIHRLKKGDEAAYEVLFKLYFEKLFHFAHSYIEDADEAREITQNVFFKIWKRRGKLSAEMNLNSYLFSMVKNGCLDYFKHEKVKINYKTELKRERASLNHSSLSENPGLLLIENELQERINLLIKQLPPRRKEIFIKSRFEGQKHREIAQELDISVKTVEHQIAKALRFFRQELQEYLGIF